MTMSQRLRQLVVIFISVASIFACSFNNYNPSVYDYHFQEQLADKQNIQTIMLAPINFNTPSRHYLTKHQEHIDNRVKDYLHKSGYKTVSNKIFRSLWKKTITRHGDLYNPTTGKMSSAYLPALEDTLQKIFTNNPKLDAILFTDLIEESLVYSKGSKKSAQWSGVRRKVKVEGIGNGLTDEFDWDKMIDGITIVTNMVNRNNELVLHNQGGIQIAQAIELHNNNGRFKRRNDLLNNEKEIMEGIQLALHPFIIMKGYPLKEK